MNQSQDNDSGQSSTVGGTPPPSAAPTPTPSAPPAPPSAAPTPAPSAPPPPPSAAPTLAPTPSAPPPPAHPPVSFLPQSHSSLTYQPVSASPAAEQVPSPAVEQVPSLAVAHVASPVATATVPRPRFAPLVATAVAAATLASVGTAGLLGAFPIAAASAGDDSTLTTQATVAAPVATSTSENPDWTAVAAAVRDSVVAISVQTQGGQGEGSGVVLDASGHVVTNNHVVEDAVAGGVTVTLSDGRVFTASVVGTDPTTDLAVLALDDAPGDLTPAVFGDSDVVAVGDSVMAVGNPLGLSSTVTTGIVSALDRPVTTSDGSDQVVTNAIQVDAAVNPGNSGGPLFDASGSVIGITSSIASMSQSSGSIGLGFAIPSVVVERVAAELIVNGSASHAYLGVALSDGTVSVDGVTRVGARVEEVMSGTPAARAGIAAGDVIVAIGDNAVDGSESLTGYVRALASGQSETLTVVRDGVASSIEVTFGELPTS